MQTLRIKKRNWMPGRYGEVLERMGIKTYEFEFPKPARRYMRKKKFIPPSVFAERYRHITQGDNQGPWQNELTPWLVGVMDVAVYPFVLTVIICKCVQSGGSEAVHNCIAYFVDRKPAPAMYIYPTRDAGKKQMKNRILPTFRYSAYLKRHLTGRDNDENNLEIRLKQTTISIAWAHSPTSLASDPMCYVAFDETDKYPATASRTETDSISLGEKRTTVFRRRRRARIWKLSTATNTTGHITVALKTEAQVVFDYFARCPECQGFQKMTFEGIKWPGRSKADPEQVEAEKLAWYECEFCGDRWDDEKRDRAVRAGEWRSGGERQLTVKKYMETFKPRKVGFHIPAWISCFVSLSESAAAFLKGLKSRTKMKDFLNNYAAEPWQEYEVIADQNEEEILRLKTELPPQVVPAGAVALTSGIDLQKIGFPYVVRAFARDYTSWLVDYNQLGTWDDLEEFLFRLTYPVEGSDRRMGIWRAALDTGGGKYQKEISITEEAYLWLQDNRGFASSCRVWGTKGSPRPLPNKVKMGSVLNKTPSGRPLKSGLQLVHLDTDRLKDLFYERMDKALSGDAGGAWLHSGVQMDYARQITAEEKRLNDKGIMTWERIRSANHYLDCECMAHVLADFEWPGGGVHLLPDRRTTAPVKKKKKTVNPFTGGNSLFGG